MTRVPRTKALQRHSLSLLLDERAGDVPDTHAAQHQDQKSRESKIIFRSYELVAQVFLLLAMYDV
jgi:hypothetical protein